MGVIEGVVIRAESPADYSKIRAVNQAAFGGDEEADLVESLRHANVVLLSLVAALRLNDIIGHILFSRMAIEAPGGVLDAVALAPLAVAPAFQRQGIGGKLVRSGLELLSEAGERIVLVVGHPAYYPRFGFSTTLARAIQHPFGPEVFMALDLAPGALAMVGGRVRYPEAFGL